MSCLYKICTQALILLDEGPRMEVSLLLEEARLAFGRQQSWSWRARGAAGFPG